MLLLYTNSKLVLVYLFHLYSIDIYPFNNTNINCIKRPVYISIFLNIDSTDNKYHDKEYRTYSHHRIQGSSGHIKRGKQEKQMRQMQDFPIYLTSS